MSLASAILFGIAAVGSSSAQSDPWPMFGQNLTNTSSTSDTGISTSTAGKLKMKWVFTTGGDVSARAAVVNERAYFPDWGGYLWAVYVTTGKKAWHHNLTDYGLPAGSVSRTSPAVANGILYIATQKDGWLIAVNATTGTLVWKSQPISPTNDPKITGSPTVANGVVYLGLTTDEEDLAADTHYPCCTTRGYVVAVKASNGTLLWATPTVPDGYSGAGIWSSGPVVDETRHTVFVTTGNNYSNPTTSTYLACVAAGGSPAACQSPQDYADAVVALDTATGAVKWGKRLMQWAGSGGSDDFNLSCRETPDTNCPMPIGPDLDFGAGANEITYKTSSGSKTIIGAGQKSGIYYALDPDTGAELWRTQVGPGIVWGTASDGKRIYVAINDAVGVTYSAGSAGSWAALDPATGKILWQKADPNGANDTGPLAVANGVVYAPSLAGSSAAPNMFALNASTGAKLWSYPAGSSVVAGASIAGGVVYWGSGYARSKSTGGKNRFYAFSLGGK
jgi:polyvinyl alcohol dehydrogenase (cytochrome)